MPCMHPIPAHRPSGLGSKRVVLGTPVRQFEVDRAQDVLDAAELLLPCGSCVGCQISRAREWAIRCSLEQQLHPVCSFLTLTYADRYCPPTLSKRDLSLFMRYLRRDVGSLRFFGCGEYGERRGRPHYHAILFGSADREAAERAWGHKGFVTLEPVTPARISYAAGYCAKKLGFFRPKGEEIDYETGELYQHQPPFLQMSRRPGIAGDFRRHWRSWRRSAIWQGRSFPVPRFLHASYRESASDSDLAALELEKLELRGSVTVRELLASEDIASARVRLKSERAML
ncbi:MAG: replication initiator protein [Microviridae sp.]|nr:MAG: replication initiator protein [Microviridae sp.]